MPTIMYSSGLEGTVQHPSSVIVTTVYLHLQDGSCFRILASGFTSPPFESYSMTYSANSTLRPIIRLVQ